MTPRPEQTDLDPTAEPGEGLVDEDGTDDGPPGPGSLTLAELRGDVPATLRLTLVVALVGLPLGAVWAWLAPGVGTVTLRPGVTGTLPGEADHAFDAIAVYVLLTVALGVVAAAVAWRRRAHRGPVMLVGVVVAALVGAWVAGRVGLWLAPTPTPVAALVDHAALSATGAPGPPTPGTYGAPPASPGPWWVALVAGLAAALTYVLAAIADGHEDPRNPGAGSPEG